MLKGRLVPVVALFCALAVAFGGGCKNLKKKNAAGTGSDVVPLDSSLGAGSLAERGGAGTKIDPGKQFENVLFAYDSAQIEPTEVGKMDSVVEFLKANAAVTVEIDGHCDERGSREYNIALGERRALAGRAYLIAAGIDGAKIQTKSLGKEQPLDPGHTEEAWRVNRRIEFSFYQ